MVLLLSRDAGCPAAGRAECRTAPRAVGPGSLGRATAATAATAWPGIIGNEFVAVRAMVSTSQIDCTLIFYVIFLTWTRLCTSGSILRNFQALQPTQCLWPVADDVPSSAACGAGAAAPPGTACCRLAVRPVRPVSPARQSVSQWSSTAGRGELCAVRAVRAEFRRENSVAVLAVSIECLVEPVIRILRRGDDGMMLQ